MPRPPSNHIPRPVPPAVPYGQPIYHWHFTLPTGAKGFRNPTFSRADVTDLWIVLATVPGGGDFYFWQATLRNNIKAFSKGMAQPIRSRDLAVECFCLRRVHTDTEAIPL